MTVYTPSASRKQSPQIPDRILLSQEAIIPLYSASMRVLEQEDRSLCVKDLRHNSNKALNLKQSRI